MTNPHQCGLGLDTAIRAAGSRRKLANLLGISAQAISQWRQIPVGRCLALERATGIPRQQLRPDVFEGLSAGAASAEQESS